MEPKKNDWHRDRNQREEHQCNQIAGKYVGGETNGQREDARQVADDLDRDHQRRQPRHRAGKVRGIVNRALRLYAVKVVIQKRHNGATQRHRWHTGGRFQARHQSNQVAGKDVQKKRRQKRSVLLAVMADNFAALPVNKALQPFKNVL